MYFAKCTLVLIQRSHMKEVDLGDLATRESIQNSPLLVSLSSNLERISINREELARAQELVNQLWLDKWEESTIFNISKGIEKKNLEKVSNMIAAHLDLTQDQKLTLTTSMNKMKFAHSVDTKIMEFSFDLGNFKSIYGFLYAIRENDGTISLAFAFHSLAFSGDKSSR